MNLICFNGSILSEEKSRRFLDDFLAILGALGTRRLLSLQSPLAISVHHIATGRKDAPLQRNAAQSGWWPLTSSESLGKEFGALARLSYRLSYLTESLQRVSMPSLLTGQI